jgi:hypothetical protein
MGVFTANDIEEITTKITQLKKTHTDIEITDLEEFLEFRTNNRMFFELILSESDIQKNVIFKQMMKMKRELESGKDQYSVDVKFGQYMADKYINPVINKN